MDEIMDRNYLKEEEFLDEFGNGGIVGTAKTALLTDEWKPCYECNDRVRQLRKQSLDSGELDELVFDSATVFKHPDKTFSSVQILLKSAKRIVNLRVRKVDERFIAEKIVDRPT